MALTKIIGSGIGTVTNQFADANMSAGSVVQVVHVQNGDAATGTTTIPWDNTIPQITEGTEFLTAAITPTSATNKLLIEAAVINNCSANTIAVTMALFVGTTANALASILCSLDNVANRAANVSPLVHFMTAGVTTELTFRIRLGGHASSTISVNADGSNSLYGGTAASTITITEIAV